MATPDSDPSLSTKRLAGKVAIITGGASGIGATAARLFVSHGALVAIADVQDSLGQSLATSLSPHAKFFHCDVSHEPDVAQLVTSTIQHFGRLDIMYINASILGPITPLQDLDIDDFDRVYAINLRGAVLCTKHAAKAMILQKKGVILATASVAAVLGGVGPLAYSISKTGLIGMLKSASFELGKYGIRVNSVSPSSVPTPMTKLYFGDGGGGPRTDEELAKLLSAPADLKGAVLMAEDVARAALFLASEEAQFVSGHNLVVDGAFSVTKGYVLTGSQQ